MWNRYIVQTTDAGGPWLIGSLETTYKHYEVLLRWYKKAISALHMLLKDAIVGIDRKVQMHIIYICVPSELQNTSAPLCHILLTDTSVFDLLNHFNLFSNKMFGKLDLLCQGLALLT